jgi:hypothetical protein
MKCPGYERKSLFKSICYFYYFRADQNDPYPNVGLCMSPNITDYSCPFHICPTKGKKAK